MPVKTYCYPAITSILHWPGSWTSILLLHLYLWKLEKEFPCIPSFYDLWLILKTWPSCIWEKPCMEAHWSCFCVNFCKHTEGPQQDLLNRCVVLFAFVCALRGLLIIITVLWCDDICCVRKKKYMGLPGCRTGLFSFGRVRVSREWGYNCSKLSLKETIEESAGGKFQLNLSHC